jgi:hypothetical protein
MIWLMVMIAVPEKVDVSHVTQNHLSVQFDLDQVAERPEPASVHSSSPMTWHSWRASVFLGLLLLALQFWPSTTETLVTTTSHATDGWSPNRTVAIRSVL